MDIFVIGILLVWAITATWAAVRYRSIATQALDLAREALGTGQRATDVLKEAGSMLESLSQYIRRGNR